MTKDEIIINYRQAKDPESQIKILADLNDCTVTDIRNTVSAHSKVENYLELNNKLRPQELSAENSLTDSSTQTQPKAVQLPNENMAVN